MSQVLVPLLVLLAAVVCLLVRLGYEAIQREYRRRQVARAGWEARQRIQELNQQAALAMIAEVLRHRSGQP